MMLNFGYFGLVLPQDCNLAAWNSYAHHLGRVVRELGRQERDFSENGESFAQVQDQLRWAIGDWLLRGKEIGVKPAVRRKRLREDLKGKYAEGTLSNFMTVCQAFKDVSRRRENVGFYVHLEVAKFPMETQEELLDAAEGLRTTDGKKYPIPGAKKFSVGDVRKVIKTWKRVGFLPKAAEDLQKEGLTTLKMEISEKWVSDLQRWGAAKFDFKRVHPVTMLGWILKEYVKEHRAELDALEVLWAAHAAKNAVERAASRKELAERVAEQAAESVRREERERIAALSDPPGRGLKRQEYWASLSEELRGIVLNRALDEAWAQNWRRDAMLAKDKATQGDNGAAE